MKTFSYDGEDFSQLCVINKVTLNLLSQTLTTVPLNGKRNRLTKVQQNPQNVKLDVQISHHITKGKTNEEIRDMLAVRLSRDEAKPLVLSNFPGRYFNAIFSETSEIDITDDELCTTTITFMVPDGLMHSSDGKKFPFAEDAVTVQNDGTFEAPLDIYIKFTSDTNAIGIASEDDVVQLGSGMPEDEADFIASNKVLNDGMGSAQKGQWSVNTGRPRFKYDNGDGSSKVMGSVEWEDSKVVVSSFGTIGKDDPGYWHGPTLVRSVGTPLENAELYHRFKLKPTGSTKNRKKAQGLLEINYLDLDGNFVMGFGLKDNDPNKAAIMYDFFIGDKRVFRGNIPKKVLNYTQGIFGYIDMKKVGNKFTFKVCHLYNGRENWSATKTFYNESIANLSIATINFFGAQWKRVQSMATEWTHTRITRINTEDDSLVPLTFYEGDDLYVDGTSNRVYINGIRNDNYRVIGSSQILEAPLGQSEYSVLTDGTYEGYLALREEFV